MKKILLLAFTAFCFGAKSQITITSTNMPAVGDTCRLSIASIGSWPANFATGGPNVTWPMDSLKATNQMMRNFVTAFSVNPFFFTSSSAEKTADSLNLLIVNFTNIYTIYKKNGTSSFNVNGTSMSYAGFPIPNTYSDPDELYKFPLTYLKHDSSTFKYSTPTTTLFPAYKKQGYRITDVDGWGSLSTPFGNVQCLRVVTTQYSQDSITGSINTGSLTIPLNIGFPNYARKYQWLTLTEHVPYVEVSGTLIFGVFIPTQVKYRDYKRNFVGIEEAEKNISFNIFPNPATNVLMINIPQSKPLTLEIYDALGKLVIKQELNNPSEQNLHAIIVEQLSTGNYNGKLFNGKAVQNFKFNKQ